MHVKSDTVDPLRAARRLVMVNPVVEKVLSSDVCDAGIPRILAATFLKTGSCVDCRQKVSKSKSRRKQL